MSYNPYQRIDKIGQKGHIDTSEKFRQLTDGIDLVGKRVLDIGCNLGMMCQMAHVAGAAKVLGIDERRDYIEQAKELWPALTFSCTPAHGITGTWDVIIMSAMFHYLKDPERVLNQVARCLSEDGVVTMDVWLDDTISDPPMQFLSARGHWIPNDAGFQAMAQKFFDTVSMPIQPALSPDDSERWIYHLVEPYPTPAKAVLIYGKGGTGKTTLAKTYHGYAHLQTDSVFISWARTHAVDTMSVRKHVDRMYRDCGPQYDEYLEFTLGYVSRWLSRKIHHDVVIEGYDMVYPEVRRNILDLLDGMGWQDVEEISL